MKTKLSKIVSHLFFSLSIFLITIVIHALFGGRYTLVFATIIGAVYLFSFIYEVRFSPIMFTMVFFFLQPVVGYFNYTYISRFIPYSPIDFKEPLIIWFFYVIFFELGFLSQKVFSNISFDQIPNIKNIRRVSTDKNILIAALMFIAISTIALLLYLGRIGTIPFLVKTELDVARFAWRDLVDSGVLKLISFNVIGIILMIYFLILKNVKSKMGLIIISIYAVVSTLFWGNRITLLIVTLFASYCYFKFHRKMKIKQLITILGILFLLLQIFVFVGFWRGGWSVHGENVVRRSVQMFTEFRDFSQAQNRFEPNDEQLDEYNIYNSAYSLVPRQILSMFGIDKNLKLNMVTFSQAYGKYYRDKGLPGFGQRLRFSTIGDLYFSFGYYGAVFIFVIGLIYGMFNTIFLKMHVRYRYFNTISFSMVLLSLIPMLAVKTYFDYINLYIYAIVLVEFLTKVKLGRDTI